LLSNEITGRPSVIIFISIVVGILLFKYVGLIFIPLLCLAIVFLFIKEKLSLFIMIILLSAWWTARNYEIYMDSS